MSALETILAIGGYVVAAIVFAVVFFRVKGGPEYDEINAIFAVLFGILWPLYLPLFGLVWLIRMARP